MSLIYKIIKLNNVRNLLLATSKLHTKTAFFQPTANLYRTNYHLLKNSQGSLLETAKRFYSRKQSYRYTIGSKCGKKMKKRKKKTSLCPQPEMEQCKEPPEPPLTMCTAKCKVDKGRRICKAGMVHACVQKSTTEECALTKGKAKISPNQCPQPSLPPCPKGDWDKEY